MRASIRTTCALTLSIGGGAVLTPASAGNGNMCFVAGDALGVELHCAAVLALATPEQDPLTYELQPVELARTWPVAAPASPAGSAAVDTWALWTDLAAVFMPELVPVDSSTMLFAIVH